MRSALSSSAVVGSAMVYLGVVLGGGAASWALGDLGEGPAAVSARDSSVAKEREATHLEELTVTAIREERNWFEVPQAVTLMDSEEIRRQTPVVLPDLLRGEGGVFVQQTTVGQAAPIIRGLIGSSVLMLVDGMRLNTAFFRPAPNQYFGLVDPYNVERLEVVRGASSTLYGSDAMGGVINVITPVPQFTTAQWEVRGRALGQFSSADTAGTTRLLLTGGKQGVAVSGGFTYRRSDDLRGGGKTGSQRPTAFEVLAADGALFVEHNVSDLLLNVQYVRQPRTPRFDELVAGFGQERPSAAVFFFEPNERRFLHGRYRITQPFGLVDRLEIHAAVQEIHDDRRSRDFGSVEEKREKNESRLLGVTLQFSSHWREWMLLTYGGEMYLDTIQSTRVTHNLETKVTAREQSRFADDSRLNSFALYMQDEIWVHPRVTAILGTRLSYFDIRIPRADRAVGTSLQISDLTGSFSLMYHVAPTVSLVTNVGRGFRVPNIFDLSTFGPRPGNRFNVPNPRLRPEQVVTVDVGVKWYWPRFSGEIFGFHSRFLDKIDTVLTGEVTPEGRRVVKNANLNAVKLLGIEADGRWRLRDHLQLFGALTFTWGAEEFRDGRTAPADRIPPLNGRVGLLYELGAHVWVESILRFAARQDRLSERDRTDPRINPAGTPGWVTVALRLGWKVHEHWSVRVAVENVLDRAYREHGSGINAPGVNAIVSLETHF